MHKSSADKETGTNCIGVWYTHVPVGSPKAPDEIECHFNFWMMGDNTKFNKKLWPGHANGDCFLDIGLMIESSVNCSQINIFIPDQLDKANIEDMGKIFKDNNNLVSAVFNEDYRVSASAQDKSLIVQKADMETEFEVYMLDLDNDVEIDRQFGGSIVRILVPKNLNGRKHYYRIRLKCAFVDRICYIYKLPNSRFLDGAFFQTELLDFRLNEKRNLPLSLLEEIRKNGEVNFKKIHFFLMREASDDYIFAHEQPRGRQLEKGTWTPYVGKEYSFEKVTAYHWKNSSKPCDNFSVFAKFRSFHCSAKTFLIAIFILLVFGVVSGIFANYIWARISPFIIK